MKTSKILHAANRERLVRRNESPPPLVVDLDGTITLTDTLAESLIKAVKKSPVILLHLPFWLMRGRAFLKESVATVSDIAVESLPYREPLIQFLREEKAKGRKIFLATAAHRLIAEGVAAHLGLFDKVLATEFGKNLKGMTKLQAINDHVSDVFVYAGDSRTDIPIWNAAAAAVLVNTSRNTAKKVRQVVPIEREFLDDRRYFSDWLRAIRVHQWLKNLLLFVPLLTAFSFSDTTNLVRIVLAFVAFSLVASATYIGNDLWDLDNDRAHPRKRTRPFASARIPIIGGLTVAGGALVLAFWVGQIVSVGFFLMLILYLMLTSAYSWSLKQYVLVDVLMLSMLYTLRILAGSVALNIRTSSWLLAFSVFMFLSLALVKRCAELVYLKENGISETRGRDYRLTDGVVLWPLGVGAALCSVVVFGLFIVAPETRATYHAPDALWLVAAALIYWLARLWIKTARGEMHDDPLIYASKDRGSRATVAVMVTLVLVARFLDLEIPQ